ncbi:MAG: AI-2E family transporter [Bacilli bacterium]|nr:AI-2E family transporter [Bacilli bacterium]
MNDKNEINYKKVNEVVSLSSKILKIFYFLIFILGIYAFTMLVKEWKIFENLKIVIGLLTPLFIGLIISWLFKPLVNYLEAKKVRRGISIIAIYVMLISFVYLLVAAIIPVLYEQVSELAKSIPSIIDSVTETVDSWVDKIDGIAGLNFVDAKNDIFIKIEEWATNLAQNLPNTLINLGSSIISGVGTFIIGLIVGAFLLLRKRNESKSLIKLLPKKYQYDTQSLLIEINSIFRSFVNGTLVLSTLVFALCTVGFSIAGLEAAALFAFFCGITNIIPYIGPYIGSVPAIVVAFSQGTGIGIAVTIVILVIQAIEGNLLQPIVMSRTMKLSPVTVIVSLLIFGYFWGVFGMILSSPIVATLKALFTFFNDKYKIIKYH